MNRTLASAWLLLIVAAIFGYFALLGGDASTLVNEAKQLSGDNLIVPGIIYILLLSIRGMTFIPSTPLLFAGLTVFPAHFTFGANMVGILASTCLVMLSINRVGIETELAKVKNKHYLRFSRVVRTHGFSAIVLWSFFPFAPTDAIVYVSSGIGVSKKKIIAGVMSGEAILNAIYVYGGNALLNLLLA